MSRYNQNDDVRQAFAARFRQALAKLGYSASDQKEMHRLFDVSAQAVRKWAEAQALPTTARLPQVASVLGVRRAWLQDGEEPILMCHGGRRDHHKQHKGEEYRYQPLTYHSQTLPVGHKGFKLFNDNLKII